MIICLVFSCSKKIIQDFFINGVSVSEQSEECCVPLCEEPPSIMQWLYRHLSGHQVRQMKEFTWKKFERTFLTPLKYLPQQ